MSRKTKLNRIADMLAVPAIFLATLLVGCDGQVYPPNGAKGPAAAISDRSLWRVSGDLRNIRSAIDGDVYTAAVSDFDYRNAVVTIDLGKPCLFNMIVIDHGSAGAGGYCRRVAVLTSNDGRNFTQCYSVAGTKRFTILNMITPVLARYVRLHAAVPGEKPWSIAEMYLK